MSNTRIYTLAKELGVKNNLILTELNKMGITGKTHSSTIDNETERKLRTIFGGSKDTPKKSPQKAQTRPETDTKKAPAQAGERKVSTSAKPAQRHETKKPDKVTGKKPFRKDQRPSSATAQKPAQKPAQKQQPHKKANKPDTKPQFNKDQAKGKKRPETQAIVKDDGKPLPEEVTASKVPPKFKKDVEAEKVEKFKAKPGMQRAFQSIRKVDSRRFQPGGGRRKGGRDRHGRHEKVLPTVTAPRKKSLKISEGMTIKEFAEIIGIKIPEIIKKFMELGFMATINQPVDLDAAQLVADGFGVKVEVTAVEDDAVLEDGPEDESKLEPRAPVITIMGHVDHGKTSLLDSLRKTKVTETEAGGITQHIGAYKLSLKGRDIVFLDTPGHEAFTAMRARGAKVTDIVVLVVAADDGVKPQTIEAIDHAKAAEVPIIVAVNKIDKPEANLDRVRSELSEHDVVSEQWGGSTIFVEVSAKQRTGLENLLEMILLQSDVMELKANPDKHARGAIVESKLDKGRGPVATVLIQSGTLSVGDAFIAGVHTGKVRALIDDSGSKLESAGPSTPVEVIGFSSVPIAGDSFAVLEDERRARTVALARESKTKTLDTHKPHKLTLDEVYSKIKEGEIKDLNIVIKTDVQGSVEALKGALESVTHPEVKVRVIHAAVGGINESDVMLASASDAFIIGFNVRPDAKASQISKNEGVDVRLYNVIYEAIDDVKKALEGLLEPTLKEKILGKAEVRSTFDASKLGRIAGCYVIEGIMSRASDGVRIIRDNIVLKEAKIASLKRFKDDVKEVSTGYECGILLENFNDLNEGDVLENFIVEKVATRL